MHFFFRAPKIVCLLLQYRHKGTCRLPKIPENIYFDKQATTKKKNKRSPEYLPKLYQISARISQDFCPNFYIGKMGGGGTVRPPPPPPSPTPMHIYIYIYIYIYIQVSKYLSVYLAYTYTVPFYYLWYACYIRQYTDKTLYIEQIYVYVSERSERAYKILAFSHSNCKFFQSLLVLCRDKQMTCLSGLHVSTKTPTKHYWGQLPPCPPPPPRLR